MEAKAQQIKPQSTFDFLKSLGFVEDPSVISDSAPGLSLDFGNFKLEAGHLLNLRFQPVVLLGGTCTTRRTTALIEWEMPQKLESWEQGAAWMAWGLDRYFDGRFEPQISAVWLEIGRQNQHLVT